MPNFKTRLYNHETPPPEEIWDHIIEELNNEKVIKMHGYRKNKLLFYGATAAASVFIIFLGSVFIKKSSNTVPTLKPGIETENQTTFQKQKDSVNREILKSIINNPGEEKEIIAKNTNQNKNTKKYLTIAGPEGQPVKISPKVATLIISADNEYPPKPIWNKEILKWQQIMLNCTISPTSANFISLVQRVANKETIE